MFYARFFEIFITFLTFEKTNSNEHTLNITSKRAKQTTPKKAEISKQTKEGKHK